MIALQSGSLRQILPGGTKTDTGATVGVDMIFQGLEAHSQNGGPKLHIKVVERPTLGHLHIIFALS